jgi:uncharacterized RDD family membrane protein YckC
VEETGPHFFDEDPEPRRTPAEPAPAWGADRSRQSGFGGDQDRRVSWGAPGADPRVPADTAEADSGDTFVFRRPTAGADRPAAGAAGGPGVTGSGTSAPGQDGADGGPRFAGGAGGSAAAAPGAGSRPGPSDEGTMTFRAVSPRAGAPGFAAGKSAAERAATQGQPPSGPAAAQPGAAGPQQAVPSVPAQSAGAPQPAPVGAATPVTTGPGGGQSSWAQQVHHLAAGPGEQPVAPWKPPVEDVFQAAARRQASARPAGLGRRLAARLIDTVVVAGVTAAAAVPLGSRALDHIQGKIDEAKLSGQTVTVWLLDGTTSAYLGVVLAVLLLTGVLYEALPIAKWGRTLGKRALGLEVRDIEAHEPPTFGAALRRWLVYSVPGLLCFGVIGVLWGLFDRPWRQCWHDKAAHTFVAG